MPKPVFFSVIIPLYNKEKHIKKTIYSVLNQTFIDFEIIIINDGSSDKSLHKAQAITDTKIKVYTTLNQGVAYARNFGIKKATGHIIAFLDADDTWYPHHLDDLKKLYNSYPNCGMYCKAYTKQYHKTIIKSNYKNISIQLNGMGIVNNYFESSLINAIAWTSAVAIPKDVLNINNFDTTMNAGEDTDLWIRIALNYPVAFYNKPSAIHNLNAYNRLSNLNTNNRNFINLDKYENIAKENKSLKKYLDVNRFAIAIQYKLVGNMLKANAYINKIEKSNLNKKQLFLIKQSSFFLKVMLLVKLVLRKFNVNLTSFN